MTEQPERDVSCVETVAQAVREIITAKVVHRDIEHARELIREHLDTHGDRLLYVASTFIAHHTTHGATTELAEDRFYYLLSRVGDLIDLAAEIDDMDPAALVLIVVSGLEELEQTDPADQAVWQALQTCLIAHSYVRRGRRPWGIQRTLDLEDMLVLNMALAQTLGFVARGFESEARERAFEVLLDEAHHILASQAHACEVTIPELVEEYFLTLAAKEAARACAGG